MPRLELLRRAIKEYEVQCVVHVYEFYSTYTYLTCTQRVTVKYGKNFDFIKQHHLAHLVDDDILGAGVTGNSTTRPGEGFQQEVKQLYRRTNH